MKKLNEFKEPIIEEEKSDYSKFDVLVRAGLANKAQMQRIHRILDKMQEEKPVFNNADRAIIQNLFNRMVDLVTNNQQIFQKTRQSVREQIEESVVATSDYKISPETGRKVRAHRFKIGDKDTDVNESQITESTPDIPNDPPFILVLKRKSIRMYPDRTKVALYYNQKIDKYFTVPYGPEINAGAIQSEETELQESVMDHLHRIVSGEHPSNRVKFADGSTRKIDHFTASAITTVHKSLNDENKKKFADMVHKSPSHLLKAADFAFKHTKTR